MVTRVLVDDRSGRHRRQILHAGILHHQRARAVVVAGYSIETPRLLLLSATDRFRGGLGNDHDQVGRYLMVQGAPQVAGRFDDEIRMFKSPPPEVSSERSTKPTPRNPTNAGGLSKPSARCRSPGPNTSSRKDIGARRCANTCATTSTGPPSARCANCCLNPTTASRWPMRKTATACRWRTSPTANATTTNSSSRPPPPSWRTSCAPPAPGRSYHRALRPPRRRRPHGRPRRGRRCRRRAPGLRRPTLYVVDGSTLPTQGSANPALTIMALAARAADLMTARRPSRSRPVRVDSAMTRRT